MTEQTVVVKNLQTNYKIFGSLGKPFLILHGWPSSSDRWQELAELLVPKGFLVIAPDLPGFGKSQVPWEAWNLDAYVEWIHEFTQKVPELQKGFYLLGHSFGGAISAKLAVKYNQGIEKLFLVSAACVRQRTTFKKFLSWVAKIVAWFAFLPGYQLFRRACYKFIFRRSDYPHVTGVMKDIYLKGISEDISQNLSFIRVPTVIIWGQKDQLTPVADANFIHKKIAGSKLMIIEGARHSLQLEVPEILVQKITDNI